MTERDDITLLHDFAATESEAAFAALVERHVNLVYSTALRSVGGTHAAEEITQAVFIILARKAGKMLRRTVLSGWLYQTTRLTAANFLRGEIRRQNREQEAYMQSTLNEPGENIWPQIAPLLDDALAKLGGKDRAAIVLRFFENKDLREVGAALGASEDAAKMRVNRALEKLRKIFGKRGVSLTTALIAGAVSANSVQAAPLGLAATVTAAAAKWAAVSVSTLTLIKGALKIMAWTKMKTAIVVGVGVLLAAGTTTTLINKLHKITQANGIDAYISDESMNVFRKAPPLLVIQPTHFPRYQGVNGSDDGPGGKAAGRDRTIKDIIVEAYNFHTPRIIFPDGMPTNRYDFLATVPDPQRELFKAEIAKTLGYTGHVETRMVDCLVLKIVESGAGKLRPGKNVPVQEIDPVHGPARNALEYNYPNNFLSVLAEAIEYRLRKPVIDRTGLQKLYYLVLDWHWKSGREKNNRETNLNALKQAMIDQLGLELVPSREPVEMLVVEKVK